MRPCLTLLSGCSEGERRNPVTHWDITHIHVHKYMHTHTHLGPYPFAHTHTNTKKVWISIFFLSPGFPHPASCCYSFTKLAAAAAKELTKHSQWATKHDCFSVSYLFGRWVGKSALSFWKASGLTEVLYFYLKHHLLPCYQPSPSFLSTALSYTNSALSCVTPMSLKASPAISLHAIITSSKLVSFSEHEENILIVRLRTTFEITQGY